MGAVLRPLSLFVRFRDPLAQGLGVEQDAVMKNGGGPRGDGVDVDADKSHLWSYPSSLNPQPCNLSSGLLLPLIPCPALSGLVMVLALSCFFALSC